VGVVFTGNPVSTMEIKLLIAAQYIVIRAILIRSVQPTPRNVRYILRNVRYILRNVRYILRNVRYILRNVEKGTVVKSTKSTTRIRI